mmetsp:Transcript_8536/g.13072  ORF Transcript_8536/g.13072 Transcript_8536/m.13072 type:complete len:232 (+) Transcript_8536:171-866(+)
MHFAVNLLRDDAWWANEQLKTLTAHGLNKHRQVQLPTARNLKCVGIISVSEAEGDITVQFLLKAVTDHSAGQKLALSATQGTLVHTEGHSYGGLLNCNWLQWQGVTSVNNCFTNFNVRNTRNHNNLSSFCIFYSGSAKVVKCKKFCNFSCLHITTWNHVPNVLSLLDASSLDPSNSKLSLELVIVNICNQNLKGIFSGNLGLGKVKNGIEQWCHILHRISIRVITSNTIES